MFKDKKISSRETNFHRAGYRIAFIIFIISLLSVFTISLGYAEKVTVVEGIIENVTEHSIKVRNNNYEVIGVPLLKSSGEALSYDALRRGKKVEIFFHDKKITSIIIHEDMVE
ncbi:MAG: hypothetical protein CO150_08510 [Nitrospirae bacterium CG_4_9_14_3_um_filter_53_35]|nr:MAG: hypothetical protein AUK29_06010 [Nitrospirae bacterium CG2_30_53_67]PIS36704.1 MAG: hypothetical protein COT35_09920 [Nitrospirae bacterium CG08_land_8_20_14_0_20_52_24]PIV82353.1 MAG: hypothetical protein COW52_14055 [Nitrospirae bacterium CG17_big_fil_post_rev_8_21_14_2_50_50_9]PIW85940.1 MAG: hypothetical protein COZ95_01895 [Nitrospirae bacterium CG_4_8_14_3_um_filter_50_41]PIX85504.1 MAG: hypothetical protein COZ32_08170 [Nitrospirae bacterium CG_4_10_14_3_um_filter_53_41]PJA7311